MGPGRTKQSWRLKAALPRGGAMVFSGGMSGLRFVPQQCSLPPAVRPASRGVSVAWPTRTSPAPTSWPCCPLSANLRSVLAFAGAAMQRDALRFSGSRSAAATQLPLLIPLQHCLWHLHVPPPSSLQTCRVPSLPRRRKWRKEPATVPPLGLRPPQQESTYDGRWIGRRLWVP